MLANWFLLIFWLLLLINKSKASTATNYITALCNMYMNCALILTLATTLSNAQFFYHQSSNFILPQKDQNVFESAPVPSSYAHPAVIENSRRDSQLPPALLKSERIYKNPQIADALAKESWFTSKEMPVLDREAEKIPREQVFKLFRNAGWIKRR